MAGLQPSHQPRGVVLAGRQKGRWLVFWAAHLPCLHIYFDTLFTYWRIPCMQHDSEIPELRTILRGKHSIQTAIQAHTHTSKRRNCAGMSNQRRMRLATYLNSTCKLGLSALSLSCSHTEKRCSWDVCSKKPSRTCSCNALCRGSRWWHQAVHTLSAQSLKETELYHVIL